MVDLIFKAVKQEIDLREMFLPDDVVLGVFNKYLIDFYQSNCIQQKALDDRYDFVYDFKVNFLLKYPGRLVFDKFFYLFSI
jgi:hypothetical protein